MRETAFVELGVAKTGAEQARTVLEIDNLQTHFFTPSGVVRAVDGVSYAVRSREILGVVGESGCGKSVIALSVLRLVADPPGRIVGGAIRFAGTNLLDLTESEMEGIRGNDISIIFQEPMTSLNPLMTVGRQISEAIALHRGLSRRDAMDRATNAVLEDAGVQKLPQGNGSVEKVIVKYPPDGGYSPGDSWELYVSA